MKTSASEKLHNFYSLFSGNDHVLVLINADPDAIASAMTVRRLLWRKVASVTIFSINIVDRPDNLAMIRLLGVQIIHIDKIEESGFNRVVIVDSQPSHSERFARFCPDAIIDHHPESGNQAPFQDIRPQYGATASIMTEYLKAAKIKPSVKLATGLFYAIKADTNGFKGQTLIEDVRAFQFLFRHANMYLDRKIERSDLKREYLKYFKCALQNMHRHKKRMFVHLGPVVNPDVCVLIADFFMRVSTVTWSIVSGLFEKKLILIFRNDGLRKNAGKLAQNSFGDIGSAGGHKAMARAEIPVSELKDLVDHKDAVKLSRWIIRRIEKKAGKK